MIANPDYAPDTYAKYTDLEYVGFELWTVNAGSVFDNVLVTDDKAYATKMAAETWAKIKEGESDAMEAWKKANEVGGGGWWWWAGVLIGLTQALGLPHRSMHTLPLSLTRTHAHPHTRTRVPRSLWWRNSRRRRRWTRTCWPTRMWRRRSTTSYKSMAGPD